MNYWLYITNSDNWKVTKKTNILGASERYRNSLSKMGIGDKCLVYVISNSEMTAPKIMGEYKVVSKVFEDTTKIFQAPENKPSERFRFRVKLERVRVFKEPIAFKPLISQLTFITNKQRYSLHIRGKAIVPIPKVDYELITSKQK